MLTTHVTDAADMVMYRYLKGQQKQAQRCLLKLGLLDIMILYSLHNSGTLTLCFEISKKDKFLYILKIPFLHNLRDEVIQFWHQSLIETV
jgi:hypothetical protein